MTPAERLAQLPDEARAAALAVLDDISRPMTKIEIEDALTGHLPRSVRRGAARALAQFTIIRIDPAGYGA